MFSTLEPLGTTDEDNLEGILDEALAEFHLDLNARVDDMHREPVVQAKPVRQQLWDFLECQVKLGNTKGIILGNAYIKYEEYLREGYGDGEGGFSDLKAGRIIASTVFPRGKKTRSNAAKHQTNKRYWYRYRARSIITGYRYLVATGCLMPEQRGKCKGTSLNDHGSVKHKKTYIGRNMIIHRAYLHMKPEAMTISPRGFLYLPSLPSTTQH